MFTLQIPALVCQASWLDPHVCCHDALSLRPLNNNARNPSKGLHLQPGVPVKKLKPHVAEDLKLAEATLNPRQWDQGNRPY